MTTSKNSKRVDFERINRMALAQLPVLCRRWLKDGRVKGREYIARNPRRHDERAGSFKVNLNSGRWADFALKGVAGGDPVSLAAYLGNSNQVEAARRIADMFEIGHD